MSFKPIPISTTSTQDAIWKKYNDAISMIAGHRLLLDGATYQEVAKQLHVSMFLIQTATETQRRQIVHHYKKTHPLPIGANLYLTNARKHKGYWLNGLNSLESFRTKERDQALEEFINE